MKLHLPCPPRRGLRQRVSLMVHHYLWWLQLEHSLVLLVTEREMWLQIHHLFFFVLHLPSFLFIQWYINWPFHANRSHINASLDLYVSRKLQCYTNVDIRLLPIWQLFQLQIFHRMKFLDRNCLKVVTDSCPLVFHIQRIYGKSALFNFLFL